MLFNTRLIYVPSLDKYLKFKEFRNDHLSALFKSQDSLVDSLCAQQDILLDCWSEDHHTLSELTMFDIMSIFITWRINCVDSNLVFNVEGEEYHQTITDWLFIVNKLGSIEFEKNIEYSDLTMTLDILNIYDYMEVYREEMTKNKGRDFDKDLYLYERLYTQCSLKKVNGYELQNYTNRKLIYEKLPDGIYDELDSYRKFVQNIISDDRYSIKIVNNKTHFKLELIPILIKHIFSGSSEAFLSDMTYLSKKVSLSFSDFLNLSPNETTTIIENIKEGERDGNYGDDGEELITN